MAIAIQQAPDGARDAVAQALRERLAKRLLDGFAGTLSLTAGIPRVSLPDIRHPRLSRARVVTWDFLVLADEETGLASARVVDCEPSFASIVRGPFAVGVLAACRIGAETLQHTATVYRPTFIASGAAAAFAVVFRADRGSSAYVDVLDGSLVESSGMELQWGVGKLLDRVGDLSSGAPTGE